MTAKKIDDNSANPYVSDKPYYHNPATGTYVFTLPSVPKPVVLPEQLVQDLVRAYSNHGQKASINECARTFGLPRAWVTKILRCLGMTHDSLPFTGEQVNTMSEDQMVAEAAQLRQAEVYRRIEREKWKSIQEDANKWRNLEAHVLARLEAAARDGVGPTLVTKLELSRASRRYCAVVTPTDFHHGKYSDSYEVGDKYNRNVGRRRLLASTDKVLADVARYGRPEGFVVGVGSDFFHIDNDLKTTTQGTAQDTDGNPAEILTSGCQLMVEYIDRLRQVSNVHLVLMSGNHDRLLGLALLQYLKAWYRTCEDVEVVDSAAARQYLEFGSTLMGFVHGDGVKKTADIARLASIEEPEAWGRCGHRVVFTGHLHSEMIDESLGVTRYQLPSLAGTDRWHGLHGYVANRKVLAAVLIDETDGVFATLYGSEGTAR